MHSFVAIRPFVLELIEDKQGGVIHPSPIMATGHRINEKVKFCLRVFTVNDRFCKKSGLNGMSAAKTV